MNLPPVFLSRSAPSALWAALLAVFLFSASPGRAQTPTFPAPPPLPQVAVPATNNLAPVVKPEVKAAVPAEEKNAPITAATLNSMDVLDDKIKLDSGDRISFRVIEDQDDAVQRLVTDSGEVDFPYLGRIKVAGKTCAEVARDLKKLLEVDYYYKATVIIGLDVIHGQAQADGAHNFVWVVGQVKQVGPQEIPPRQPLTVSQAILRAGGFSDFSDQRKVRFIHHVTSETATAAAQSPPSDTDLPKDVILVDVKAVFEGKSLDDPIVQPNDMIVVPKRSINF